jgi:hypothetical protein
MCEALSIVEGIIKMTALKLGALISSALPISVLSPMNKVFAIGVNI